MSRPVETVSQALERFATEKAHKHVWKFYNDELAISDSYTYQELEYATNALSAHLIEDCGLKTGDLVLLVFLPGLSFVATLVACYKAGLVAVPVYPPDVSQLAKHLIHFTTIQKDCGAKVALTDATFSRAKSLSDLTGLFSFGKRSVKWPDLRWIEVESTLRRGKTIPSTRKQYPTVELAFIQYTSGSTSAPKGAMITHWNLANNVNVMAETSVAITTEADAVCWLPQYHDLGLVGHYMFVVKHGFTGSFMSPLSFLKDPLNFMRLMSISKAIYTVVPNFALGLIVRKLREAKKEVREAVLSLEYPRLEIFGIGAEPLDAKTMRIFFNQFRNLPRQVCIPFYGLAENTLCVVSYGKTIVEVCRPSLEANKLVIKDKRSIKSYLESTHEGDNVVTIVSVGQLVKNIEVRIVNPETHRLAADNEPGEIWVNSSSTGKGYFNRPEQTEEGFRAKVQDSPENEEFRFLRTGDLGFVEDNELFLCGRLKDLLIISGLNYYPHDIEHVAEQCCEDAIRAGCSAAFAIKNEISSTEAAVFVAEIKLGVKESEFRKIAVTMAEAVANETGVYLQDIVLIATKSVPKTTSGKISRAACKKAYLENTLKTVYRHNTAISPDTKASPKPLRPALTVVEVEPKVIQMLQKVANLEAEITPTTNLMQLGLSSISATELCARVNQEFSIKARPTVVLTSPTVRDISLHIVDMVRDLSTSHGNSDDDTSTEQSEVLFNPDQPEAHIAAWGIAVPLPFTTENFLKFSKADRLRSGQTEKQLETYENFVRASKIQRRHSCHPRFLPEGLTPADFPDAVGVMPYDIYSGDGNPTLSVREACFDQTAVKLCIAAAERALKKWGKDKSNITHIISTCTSGWKEPGIACGVIEALGLSEDICKQELNYNGCFCGASCLRLARDIIRGGLSGAVLVVACEVSTTHYNFTHTDPELMIAQSLFADGAACIILDKEGEWMYTQTGGAVIPKSTELLGLRPPHKGGETSYSMTLSKTVSASLYKYFSKEHGKDLIAKMWNKKDKQRPALAIHPGGPRILEAVGDRFFELGWKEESMKASYDTFYNYGNLGCAAMLFVLSHRLEKKNIEEDKLITMAFGPGVTVEYGLLQRKSTVKFAPRVSPVASVPLPPSPESKSDAVVAKPRGKKLTTDLNVHILVLLLAAVFCLILGEKVKLLELFAR